MATFRQRALNEAAAHHTDRYYIEEGPVSEYFGKNVLDLDKMQAYMSPQAYEAVLASVKYGAKLDRSVSDEIAEGIYSNLAIISHSSTDFVLDFIRIVPNTPKAKVKSRVIITPENAKRLLRALKDNITKYESRYGKIEGGDEEGGFSPPFPMNFGNSGEA
jgi:hypothetical protein